MADTISKAQALVNEVNAASTTSRDALTVIVSNKCRMISMLHAMQSVKAKCARHYKKHKTYAGSPLEPLVLRWFGTPLDEEGRQETLLTVTANLSIWTFFTKVVNKFLNADPEWHWQDFSGLDNLMKTLRADYNASKGKTEKMLQMLQGRAVYAFEDADYFATHLNHHWLTRPEDDSECKLMEYATLVTPQESTRGGYVSHDKAARVRASWKDGESYEFVLGSIQGDGSQVSFTLPRRVSPGDRVVVKATAYRHRDIYIAVAPANKKTGDTFFVVTDVKHLQHTTMATVYPFLQEEDHGGVQSSGGPSSRNVETLLEEDTESDDVAHKPGRPKVPTAMSEDEDEDESMDSKLAEDASQTHWSREGEDSSFHSPEETRLVFCGKDVGTLRWVSGDSGVSFDNEVDGNLAGRLEISENCLQLLGRCYVAARDEYESSKLNQFLRHLADDPPHAVVLSRNPLALLAPMPLTEQGTACVLFDVDLAPRRLVVVIKPRKPEFETHSVACVAKVPWCVPDTLVAHMWGEHFDRGFMETCRKVDMLGTLASCSLRAEIADEEYKLLSAGKHLHGFRWSKPEEEEVLARWPKAVKVLADLPIWLLADDEGRLQLWWERRDAVPPSSLSPMHDGGDELGASDESVLAVGTRVERDKGSGPQRGVISKVHYDDVPPYYSFLGDNGWEAQTVRSYLRVLSEAELEAERREAAATVGADEAEAEREAEAKAAAQRQRDAEREEREENEADAREREREAEADARKRELESIVGKLFTAVVGVGDGSKEACTALIESYEPDKADELGEYFTVRYLSGQFRGRDECVEYGLLKARSLRNRDEPVEPFARHTAVAYTDRTDLFEKCGIVVGLDLCCPMGVLYLVRLDDTGRVVGVLQDDLRLRDSPRPLEPPAGEGPGDDKRKRTDSNPTDPSAGSSRKPAKRRSPKRFHGFLIPTSSGPKLVAGATFVLGLVVDHLLERYLWN